MDPQNNQTPISAQSSNLQYARQQQGGSAFGNSQPPTQRDVKKVIKIGILVGLVILALLALVTFLTKGPNNDFETRTQDWANFTNRDFGIAFRYPPSWNLNVGTQELVELSINQGDGVDEKVLIEAVPNPDWLEVNDWLAQVLGATQFEAYKELQLSGRGAYVLETNENFKYYISSGPRVFSITTDPKPSQEILDLLESLSVDVIARGSSTESAGELIDFEPIAFKIVFDQTNLPDTRNIDNRPAIFGDSEADAKIQSLAETRGYILRSEYTGETAGVNGFAVANRIKDDWDALEAAASKAGHDLDVTSGLRSVAEQRDIFKGRLVAACANEKESNCSLEEIKSGSVDSIIDNVLATTSIPGYSRHHSGYTIDMQHTGQGALDDFAKTDGYGWISENNFANAKRFGFIPSYPEGVERQGPDPEPWEFVWVGRDFLRNFE